MQYSRGVRGTRPELPQSREQPLFCMHPDNGVCSDRRLELAWSRRVTAPAACAACNDHESCVSTAIDTPAAAIQAPGFRKPMISLDDTFSKAQTDRRTTQLLAPGETPSPSQLDQPSRRGYGAVPSPWASRVLPASVRCEEQARGTAESKRSPVYQKISLHTGPLAPLLESTRKSMYQAKPGRLAAQVLLKWG